MSNVVVRREGELWWVGLNRPDRRNAHDEATVAEFDAVPDTMKFDTVAQALLFDSPDKHERMTAFLERKKH